MMSLYLFHLVLWMQKRTTPSVNKNSNKWWIKRISKKKSNWRRVYGPERFQIQLKKTSMLRCLGNKRLSARMQRSFQLPKQRPTRHHSISMSGICRQWKKSKRWLSCHRVLLILLHSVQRKYHGRFLFHFIKRWWTTRRMTATKELRNSRLLQCPCRSCHQEWKLMLRKDRKRRKRSKRRVKFLTLHSSHHCLKKCLTSKDCIRNLLLRWRGIRAHKS